MMYFKSEDTKIGLKTYLILGICLVVYFLAAGYGFMLIPFTASFVFIVVGVVISVLFLLYYLKINSK